MGQRKWILLISLIAVVFLLSGVNILFAEDSEDKDVNKYLGNNAKTCKMCHKDQVAAWEKWPMSKSWDRLSDEEKKKEECIVCHVTGYGKPGGFVSEKETPTLVGITCEACHGPAQDHMKAPLTDKEARMKSMSKPDEANCLMCHIEEGNPNFKEFDYKKAVTELEDHLVTEKTE